MTRDEAIMILKNEQPHCGKRALFPEEKKYEAYDVAIKALEQQTCEDAVSREAVLDIFADNVDATRPYSTAWEKIRDLPSVNPQQRVGHWIQTQEKDDAEPFILWECSCCHKEFRGVVHKVSNYCPNCGAKMVEPQERSEE